MIKNNKPESKLRTIKVSVVEDQTEKVTKTCFLAKKRFLINPPDVFKCCIKIILDLKIRFECIICKKRIEIIVIWARKQETEKDAN